MNPVGNTLVFKGWLKKKFFTYYCTVFHIFVAGNRKQFKIGMWIDRSRSQQRTTNCPWNGRGHVTHVIQFKFQGLTSNGYGYGHVTVLKFCSLPWCSSSVTGHFGTSYFGAELSHGHFGLVPNCLCLNTYKTAKDDQTCMGSSSPYSRCTDWFVVFCSWKLS